MIKTVGKKLQHLAIIPDGNRRWAKKHNVISFKDIYNKGAIRLVEIIEESFRREIPYLTIWASSYFNLRLRPARLVYAMEKLYSESFRKLSTAGIIVEKGVKVNVIGEWRNLLRKETIDDIDYIVNLTSYNTEKTLTILIGYDGQRERGAAIMALINKLKIEGVVLPDDFTATDLLLRSCSWTGHLPDVDLIVRTGSYEDPHNSAGFLSFLSGESQFCFPDVLWPEFSSEILNSLLQNFKRRERRFGK